MPQGGSQVSDFAVLNFYNCRGAIEVRPEDRRIQKNEAPRYSRRSSGYELLLELNRELIGRDTPGCNWRSSSRRRRFRGQFESSTVRPTSMPTDTKPLFETEFVLGTEGIWFQRNGLHKPGNHNGGDHNAEVEVYFREIKSAILSRIEKYPVVAGCVAWLTDFDIINALASKEVSIILQKEDLFRLDLAEDPHAFRSKLRKSYDSVPGRFDFAALPREVSLSHLNNCYGFYSDFYGDGYRSGLASTSMNAFRCAGNHNANNSPAFPRMHNKFMVFCEHSSAWSTYIPVEVWTGSYNMSSSASYGFENGVAIKSYGIAMSYLKEFCDIALLSEPLDWTHGTISPEFGLNGR